MIKIETNEMKGYINSKNKIPTIVGGERAISKLIPIYECLICGKEISKEVYNASYKKCGMHLCIDCYKS